MLRTFACQQSPTQSARILWIDCVETRDMLWAAKQQTHTTMHMLSFRSQSLWESCGVVHFLYSAFALFFPHTKTCVSPLLYDQLSTTSTALIKTTTKLSF